MFKLTKPAALVAGAAVLLAVGSTGGAVAGSLITGADIRNNSLTSSDIRKNGVGNSEITPFSVTVSKLSTGARNTIAASDKLGESVVATTFATTPIPNIGGSFATRSTQVGSFDLEPGTYLLSTDGFFINNAATSGLTRMQVAVRGVDGSTFGSDLGTCFTGLISTLPNREATCNTTRTVVIDAPTTVSVKAFGYADDQGSADGGKVDASLSVSAVKVG